MSSMSDYLEKEIADHIFGRQTYSAPSPLYFALFTSAPSDAGGGTEVSAGGYARKNVTNDTTNFSGATMGTGVTSNTTTIEFNEATASWGTVTHWGIFDSLTGGNLLFHGALTASKTIASGDQPKFKAGSFQITFA